MFARSGLSAVFLCWRGRGAVCPLCFLFGEGGFCALLFLVYEYHQGATSNLQDRNRDMAIASSMVYARTCIDFASCCFCIIKMFR